MSLVKATQVTAWVKLLIWVALGWYVLMATHHYFNQRPLWNDEECIFINVRDNKPQQLFTQPLSHVQQFPRLYILLIQQTSKYFDYSMLALRFFPFVCMLVAFFVWWRIALRQLKKDQYRLLFLMCWAASMPLVYYAAELKQYSMDVLSGGLFITFLYHQQRLSKDHPARYKWLLFCLPMLFFFSYTSFLFFIFPLVNIIRSTHRRWPLLIYMASCAMVLALVFWFDMRVSNAQALRNYWQEYFISFASIGEFFRTVTEGINNLISRWFAEDPKWIRAASRVFMALGFWQVCATWWGSFKGQGFRCASVNSVAFVLFLELFALGALHMYAFSVPRTSLFFCPILFFLTAQFLEQIKEKNKYISNVLFALLCVYLIYVSLGIAGVIWNGSLGAQSPIWQVPPLF